MSDAEGLVKEMRRACEDGDIETVRSLLGRGADINIIDESGSTPLIYAISYGEKSQAHKDVIKLLLKEGANLDIIDGDGLTVLMSAASRGDMENVRLFLDNDADPNIVSGDGEDMTALMIATDAGHPDIVELITKHIAKLPLAQKSLAVAKSMLLRNEGSPLNYLDTDTMQKMFSGGARGMVAAKKGKKSRKKTRKSKKTLKSKKTRKPKKTLKSKKTRKPKKTLKSKKTRKPKKKLY
jgi:ankyrin repeat protein